MKKLDNPYSKYRYDNTYTPKFRVDTASENSTRMYGVELRSYKSNIKAQMPSVPATWIANGATWVVNNVFRCNQVNKVDQPMVNDKNAPRRTFFKLFKL
jgi:hypothetical protein